MGSFKSGPRFLIPFLIIIGIITAGAFAFVQYKIAVDAENPAATQDINLDPTIDENEGQISVLTNLKNQNREIIRQVDDWRDSWFQEYSIVDPDSDEEVKYYGISVFWTVSGSHIDWSTLSVSCNLLFEVYSSPAATKEMKNSLERKTVTNLQNEGGKWHGECIFEDIDLDKIMPDDLTIIYRDYNEETGRKEVYAETYPQKTSDPHPFTMKFRADFTMTVNDEFGNQYTESFTMRSKLGLMWGGSSFDVEWSSSDDMDGSQEVGNTQPVLTHANDVTREINSGAVPLSWTVSDDGDSGTYSITKDGVEVASGSWTDGNSIVYNAPTKLEGLDVYELTVTDSLGKVQSDDVEVFIIDSNEFDTDLEPNPDLGTRAEDFDSYESVDLYRSSDVEGVAMNILGAKISGYAVAVLLFVCVAVIAVWYKYKK